MAKPTSMKDRATSASDVATHEEDTMRANFYGLISRVLVAPMDDETLQTMRALAAHDDPTPLGQAIRAFGKLCERTPRAKVAEEFGELFYGYGAGGELTPYESYYLTGLVYDKPLAALRGDMARLGIARNGDNGEPEDHIATLCEIMHGLLSGSLGGADGRAEAHAFFNAHLAPWAGKFFTDLEGAKSASVYMPVGTIGRLFMEVEREAFALAA